MTYAQIMEFDMDSAEAVELMNKYAEEGKGVSYARRALVCADRNRPGKIIQIVFFNSVEEAELNNELDITQTPPPNFRRRWAMSNSLTSTFSPMSLFKQHL